jgi:ATP-dependent Lon protease
MRPERIPLFPLNVVLLPGAELPLHIFEPRYRRMVRACLDEKSPFGMLLALPEGVASAGCTAEILEVTKRYEDGRMDILTVGRDPFRVLQFFEDNPLLEGRVDYLEDGESGCGDHRRQELTELYETCHTLIFGDYPHGLENRHNTSLAYEVAGALPIDLLHKQQLLECREESDRRERLLIYLREWAPHLQRVRAKRQGAGGNGCSLN